MSSKPAMSLADVLEEYRISLADIDLSRVQVRDPQNYRAVRGRIPEVFVTQWLSCCPSVEQDADIPRRVNGYSLERRAFGGIGVQDAHTEKLVREIDGLIWYQRRPFVVEVKGGSLKQGARRVVELLETGRHIYGRRDVGLAVFLRFAAYPETVRRRLTRHFPTLEFVDLGYPGWHMKEAIRDYRRMHQQQVNANDHWHFRRTH